MAHRSEIAHNDVAASAADVAEPSAPEGGADTAILASAVVTNPRATALPSGVPDIKLGRLQLFLQAARDPAIDAGKLAALRAMAKEDDAEDARRAFFAALAAAKGEFGPILKTRVVDFPHKEREDREAGGRTKYKYEELADISAVVDPILSKHGLAYRHKTTQGQGGKMTVTCILSHADGWFEENSLDGVEDKSGQKNPNQSIASTVTYLQRYTLKEALGVGAGRDDDAGGFDDPMITADDVIYIEQLIADTGGNLDKLLKTVGAESVAAMRASQFKQAAWLLETAKRREKKKAEADGSAQS